MTVMKFGGSSLANAERIASVCRIVEQASRKDGVAVVLSAMQGVTDRLMTCAGLAEKGHGSYRKHLEALRKAHLAVVQALFTADQRPEVTGALEELFGELEDILHGVELLKECSQLSQDLIASFGERLCVALFARYLSGGGCPATAVDAREIVITDGPHGHSVLFSETYKRIRKRMPGIHGIPVVTGFIASTKAGVTTTLGRNGSDYTASLMAAGLEADAVEIWTDVDGVMSADPRHVRDSFVIPELSYEEAMELAYFGAKVLHPYTMVPAFEKGIPIRIRNTLNPEAAGTVITDRAAGKGTPITGLAAIEDVALVNVEGGGMIGIPGFAARIFSALARSRVNIMMISQASSEHSICLVFQGGDVEKVQRALRAELADELAAKRIQDFEFQRDLAIVAVIGENMRGTPGISGRLFSALGAERVNVLAIAQGSSERNISFVIEQSFEQKALQCIHGAFLNER